VFDIGSSLRRARERLGLELPQVEQQTRIRTKYLKALEDERFDVLPGDAYAKGFLRVYADFLGLEGERFVDEFNQRFPPEDIVEPAPLVRVHRRRRLLTARLVVIPVVLSLALFVWRIAFVGGGGTHQHVAFAPPTPKTRLSTSVPTAPTTTTTAHAPTMARLAFVATRGTCWLSVRDASQTGRVLYERTLQLGQTARVAGSRLWVRLGAPWNLHATLNGKPVGLPAAIGNILVTPRRIESAP
jgi:cytoskeleton protein RodZ